MGGRASYSDPAFNETGLSTANEGQEGETGEWGISASFSKSLCHQKNETGLLPQSDMPIHNVMYTHPVYGWLAAPNLVLIDIDIDSSRSEGGEELVSQLVDRETGGGDVGGSHGQWGRLLQ